MSILPSTGTLAATNHRDRPRVGGFSFPPLLIGLCGTGMLALQSCSSISEEMARAALSSSAAVNEEEQAYRRLATTGFNPRNIIDVGPTG